MRINYWSSDVCSSDLGRGTGRGGAGSRLLEPARRKFRMAREAGADHVAELRGVLALPYLSRWPRHGEPLGGRDRADEDERTQPLLLQLSQARHWPHADRLPARGRHEGRKEADTYDHQSQ